MVDVVAKGTATGKGSGATTLQVNSVAMTKDDMMVVCVAYDDVQGHPTSVKWGNRDLKRRVARDPADPDIGMSIWTAGRIHRTDTKNVVVTWAGTVVERAMVVTSLSGVNKVSSKTGKNETVATGSPTIGDTAALDSTSDFALAYFCMEGPQSNDTVGTLEVKDAGTFTTATTGQRAGTVGAPPVSNVGIQELYLQLTSCVATNARITGATARKWVCGFLTLTPLTQYVAYYARTKCALCGDIIWCDNDLNSITCTCSDTSLNPDGTGTNLTATNDTEMLAHIEGEEDATTDVIILVEM